MKYNAVGVEDTLGMVLKMPIIRDLDLEDVLSIASQTGTEFYRIIDKEFIAKHPGFATLAVIVYFATFGTAGGAHATGGLSKPIQDALFKFGHKLNSTLHKQPDERGGVILGELWTMQ